MLNLCIHGHFYQPPRENPWTGEIAEQPSASPYHDWNERIWDECYSKNTQALIPEDGINVVGELNNFEYLNFNFGPTLFDWLLKKHPETLHKITEADKKSIQNHNGHGNAIAQCYNHMIMPLANLKDKITQVRWGLRHFEHFFNRKPEGIWLPETACNQETIEVLVNEDIKFIILDSSQAEKIKDSDSGEWINVTGGNFDTGKAYRCYSEIDSSKYISVFFYHGLLSKSIAFDDVLSSSSNLLNGIKTASLNLNEGSLLSIATDGETFGHHKNNAERTLANFIKVIATENKIRIVNYAEYLFLNPATDEVKIKQGNNNEGTSWSCAHGVERWKDDCGCGGGEWNQKWRKPLRDALNFIRDEMIKVFEVYGSMLLKDVWQTRNDYIELMLNPSHDFYQRHASKILSANEVMLAHNLLEMQRYSMLMFTSCGWFFSEISGLETVKILEYAKRAMELCNYITGYNMENEFKRRLEAAPSNLKKYGNGKIVYEKLVEGVDIT